MAEERYDLYVGDTRVGVVTQAGADFPSLHGSINYDPILMNASAPNLARLRRFIALNEASSSLIDAEHERDISTELAPVNRELEEHFGELIESEAWRLVDSQQRAFPILCPLLRPGGGITWRWGASR